MTQKQFESKVNRIIKENDLVVEIKKEIIRLSKSGGIDLSKYENDFIAPKICTSVALKNISDNYQPFSDDLKKIAKNLIHF